MTDIIILTYGRHLEGNSDGDHTHTRLPIDEDLEGAKLYSRELARYADEDRVHVILKHSGKQGQMR